jgi:uncharacterized membrane protein YkgB
MNMRAGEMWSHASWRRASVPDRTDSISAWLEQAAGLVMRGSLVIVILWFGIFKFTPTEAQAIQPLLANSPLFSWLYDLTDVRGASRVIGVVEIAIALLIASRPFSRRAAAIGSIGAVAMFLSTLSFLATTPGMWARVDGILVPSGGGIFLIKDLFLLGAALWSAAEALMRGSGRSARG